MGLETSFNTINDLNSAWPLDADDAEQGAAHLRGIKTAVKAMWAVDHDDVTGKHSVIQLPEQDAPSSTANEGRVYTKDVSGATELFYMDAAGNEIQITSGGQMLGGILQKVRQTVTTPVQTTATIPQDDTLPLISEGADTGVSLAITPSNTSNILEWSFVGPFSRSEGSQAFAVFQDNTCVFASSMLVSVLGDIVILEGYIVAGGTSQQTWSVRFGQEAGSSGTVYFLSDQGTNRYGSARKAFFTLTERLP